jgi:hypothetical protein
MAKKEVLTVIGCRRKYSRSAGDWELCFEGAASKMEIKARVKNLLKHFHHVKAFAEGRCIAACSRGGRDVWDPSFERADTPAVRARFVNGGLPDSSRRRH